MEEAGSCFAEGFSYFTKCRECESPEFNGYVRGTMATCETRFCRAADRTRKRVPALNVVRNSVEHAPHKTHEPLTIMVSSGSLRSAESAMVLRSNT